MSLDSVILLVNTGSWSDLTIVISLAVFVLMLFVCIGYLLDDVLGVSHRFRRYFDSRRLTRRHNKIYMIK